MLDSTFGINGKANISYEYSSGSSRDIAITKDGKIFVLSFDNNLVRLNSDGTLDLTFGNQGKLSLADYGYPYFSGDAVAIEADDSDRIVLVTTEDYYFDHKMYVYRLLQDGLRDSTFNNGADVTFLPLAVNRALFIESDERILVGGANDDGYDFASLIRINADGSFDPAFNLTFNLNASFIFAITEQADGKVLAAGTTDGNAFIVRILPDGDIDSLFGTNGFVFIDDGNSETAQGISILPDGKILVVGHSESTLFSSMLCWRFLDDGSPDNTFGSNGEETLYSGANSNFPWFVFTKSDSTSIIGASLFNGVHTIPVLYHLKYDGSVDSSFGSNGIGGETFVCGQFGQIAGDTTSDGKIVICGTANELGSNMGTVSKFMADGTPDNSFSNEGTATFTTTDTVSIFDSYFSLDDFLPLQNGEILAAGGGNLIFFRLTNDGALDSSFGANGFYLPNQGVESGTLLMAADSNAVYSVQRQYSSGGGLEDLLYNGDRFSIFKFHSDGTPDSSYGVEGMVEHAFDYYGEISPADFAIQQDHKLLIAMNDFTTASHISFMRFNTDGSIDSSFATNGKLTFDNGQSNVSPTIASLADGKILCVYFYYAGLDTNMNLNFSRLLPDGSIDSSFGINGTITYLVHFNCRDFLLQQDQKVIAYGIHSQPAHSNFLRINEVGSIDSSYGIGGILTPQNNFYFTASLQPDDELLLSQEESYSVGLYRYLADGNLDSSFGNAGRGAVDNVSSTGDHLYRIRMQNDGKILVAGNDGSSFMFARFLNGAEVSVNDVKDNPGIHVFPNPASDKLIISCQLVKDQHVKISVMNMTENFLLKENRELSGNIISLDVSRLPPGIYLLSVQSSASSLTTKFVKQ